SSGWPLPGKCSNFLRPRSINCWKCWQDLRWWTSFITLTKLGRSFQQKKCMQQSLTSVMCHTQALAYPDLDGDLKAREQRQG
ncbi:hypothetical protein NDU88_001416, partial [Pleurodeles waltl]